MNKKKLVLGIILVSQAFSIGANEALELLKKEPELGSPVETPGIHKKGGYPKVLNHLLDPNAHKTNKIIDIEDKQQEKIEAIRRSQEEELTKKLQKAFEENMKIMDSMDVDENLEKE